MYLMRTVKLKTHQENYDLETLGETIRVLETRLCWSAGDINRLAQPVSTILVWVNDPPCKDLAAGTLYLVTYSSIIRFVAN